LEGEMRSRKEEEQERQENHQQEEQQEQQEKSGNHRESEMPGTAVLASASVIPTSPEYYCWY
jgi:hypothetical protein